MKPVIKSDKNQTIALYNIVAKAMGWKEIESINNSEFCLNACQLKKQPPVVV